MTIKQISLTLFSLVFIFTTGLAEETTPTSEKKIAALVMCHKMTTEVGLFISETTYEKPIRLGNDFGSKFQKLEDANGALVCDCNIPGFPKTVKLYHYCDSSASKQLLSAQPVGCEELMSQLQQMTPESQKVIAEKLSANE